MAKKSVQQRINATNRTRKSSSKKKPVMVIVPIVVVSILILATVIVLGKPDDTVTPNDIVITEDNVGNFAEQQEEKNNNVATGSYDVSMNYDWTIDASTGISKDAYVGNSKNNTSTVYTTVTLDSTGETIYKSPYIAVGSHIENITLDKTPDKGVHAATMTYHLVDGNFDEMSSVSVAITLTVQ
ncbi:MAG: hypothetical protein E7265_01850 [Lachnospiraceae bacterium]|nr:hypothetical protein [Lachnospiraceae bacterium]MBE5945037.1 hypothetical protein [Lachnospiraceae bacterium]